MFIINYCGRLFLTIHFNAFLVPKFGAFEVPVEVQERASLISLYSKAAKVHEDFQKHSDSYKIKPHNIMKKLGFQEKNKKNNKSYKLS